MEHHPSRLRDLVQEGRKVLSQQRGMARIKQHRHYRTLHSRTQRPAFASTRPAEDKGREQSGMEEKELMSSPPN